MGWTDSDIWQWWLEHGFDGIAGGFLGAAATGLAVWATLRYEIRRGERTELRQAVAELHGSLLRRALPRPETQEGLRDWYRDIAIDCVRVDAITTSKDEPLRRDVRAAEEALSSIFSRPGDIDSDEMARVVRWLIAHIHLWLRDPDGYKEGPSLVESLAESKEESSVPDTSLEDSEDPKPPRV